MNQYEEMAVELIAKASRWDPAQLNYQALMNAAGQFAIAAAIQGATDVLASLNEKVAFAIDQQIEEPAGHA